jgi:hypothetical protein
LSTGAPRASRGTLPGNVDRKREQPFRTAADEAKLERGSSSLIYAVFHKVS